MLSRLYARLSGDRGFSFGEPTLLAVVLLATCYFFVLCGVATNLFRVSNALVGLVEVLILCLTLPVLLRRLHPGLLAAMLLFVCYLLTMWLYRGAMDVMALRNILIPFFFLWLGINCRRLCDADFVVFVVSIVVLLVALFEYFLFDLHAHFFNINGFYIARGAASAAASGNTGAGTLNFNGVRIEGVGRAILPAFLMGLHRVSSVFLEPVSMGNFSALLAAWALSLEREAKRLMIFYLLISMVLVVLADSRFGLLAIMGFVLIRLVLPLRYFFWLNMAPLAAAALTIGLYFVKPSYFGDDFLGRLIASGRYLTTFDIDMLLSVKGFAFLYGDMGFAYIISRFGLPVLLLVWLMLLLLPATNAQAIRFRAMAFIYIGLILAISGTSLFAMKTAALLWFLFGAVGGAAWQSRPLQRLAEPWRNKPGELVP